MYIFGILYSSSVISQSICHWSTWNGLNMPHLIDLRKISIFHLSSCSSGWSGLSERTPLARNEYGRFHRLRKFDSLHQLAKKQSVNQPHSHTNLAIETLTLTYLLDCIAPSANRPRLFPRSFARLHIATETLAIMVVTKGTQLLEEVNEC